MTTGKKVELKEIFEIYGSVTVTAVSFDDDEAVDYTYDSFNEAVVEIERLENGNTVYF